jgi:hypothetical protein
MVGKNTGGSAAHTAVDIAALTTKGSPADGDYVLLSDQAASGAWKKATVSSVGASAGVSTIAGNTGAFTLSGGVTNSTNDITLASGCIIGSVIGTYTANTSLSTVFPADDTIPQIGEGTQIISVSYTPKLSTSTLLCEFSGMVSPSANDNIVGAMFNGAANAFGAAMVNSTGANIKVPLAFRGTYAPGSTSAQTITVRVGPTSAANVALNGNPGARFLGGASAAILTVYEIKA